jgi:UPF0755 protein
MTKRSKLIIIILTILVIGGLIGGVIGKKYYDYIFASNIVIETESGYDYLFIPTGSDFDDVIDILNKNGWLKDTESFRMVAEKKNYPLRVLPGKYLINNNMSNNELVNLLRSGRQEPVNVSFISVRTLEILAGRLAQNIEADSTSIIKLMKDPEVHTKYGFNQFTFKSMFIPNTYQLYWNTSAEDVIQRMADEYKKFWNDDRKQKAAAIGYTQSQISSIASIVEAETQKNDEKERVAGVYINRLKKGWKLEADPTVVFATGDFTLQRVLFRHLEIDSPYNTYKYPGIPPGPINIPSVSSIDAVLNYEKHDYMFFCAKDDFSGYHSFAITLSQHNANARKYHEALRRAGIR